MTAFLSALFTILRPVIAEVIVRVLNKRDTDEAFKADLDASLGLVKSAQSKEEKLNAAKAFQDALFR